MKILPVGTDHILITLKLSRQIFYPKILIEINIHENPSSVGTEFFHA
jgi:hypothetical protein